jgi:tRNA (cytosine49-C5)-methyltransferase
MENKEDDMLKPINRDIEFKENFITRYKTLTDWKEFKKYSTSYLRKCIRVNTLKADVKTVKKRMTEWTFTPVPWNPNGFWLQHKQGRLDIGNTLEHVLGYIYVQEAASQIPPLVLDPQPGEVVLDMSAAPGSKASQLSALMQNKGVLVANDVTHVRLAALGINLQRMGVVNNVMTQMKGENIRNVQFDKILVDAPCSGTGTIRKSLKTLRWYNPKMITKLSRVQHRLLLNAFKLLKPGGVLVYSTCSLEPEEDEGVVDYLLSQEEKVEVMPIKLNIKRADVIMEFEGKKYHESVKHCLRIWPQDNDTEGFFVAKIRKNE